MSSLQENDLKRLNIAHQIKSLRPDAIILGVEKKLPKLVYFTVSYVKNEVVIEKNERHIYINDKAENIIKNKLLTEQEAKDAILKVLPKAQEKFKVCREAYFKVHKDLEFSSGLNYEGDTYGIYDEYEYISFKIENFYFKFELGG